MRKMILATLMVTGAMASTSAMATQVNITASNPVIDLTVTETVETRPDIATFSTGVQTMAPTASEAVRANNVQMASVVARLKKLGIAERDIQTTQINLNQQFDYRDGKQVFMGYQASNMVNAKLRDLKKLGAFLDALAVDGATNLYSCAVSLTGWPSSVTRPERVSSRTSPTVSSDEALPDARRMSARKRAISSSVWKGLAR